MVQIISIIHLFLLYNSQKETTERARVGIRVTMISLLRHTEREGTIMGQKDLAGKQLLQMPDVFADISNVNLFQGEQILTEQNLSIEPTSAIIRSEERGLQEIHSDIHMKYMDDKGIAYFKIENQSDICNTMPVRDMGYQYAGYQQQIKQLLKDNKKEKISPKKYSQVLPDGQKLRPVITMVLNYNQKKWEAPISLKQMLEIPDRLRKKLDPWISDYSIHVINLAHQDEKTVEKYQSDFRMVVEYLVNPKGYLLQRWTKEKRKIRHPVELADMLYSLSNDRRYEILIKKYSKKTKEGDVIEMCELLDLLEERGMQRGIEQASSNLNALIQNLTAEERYDDLARSAVDRDFQNQLLKEYKII